MIRQSIISIYKPLSDNTHEPEGHHIIFRQPFNDYGLSYEFNFTRNYFAPFADVQVRIYNTNDQINSLFNFDYANFKRRPKIEIHAGYTDYRMSSPADADTLESNLNLLFIGYPYYVQASKIPGGTTLDLKLSDVMPSNRAKRTYTSYRRGVGLVSVILPGLLSEAGVQYDLSKLTDIQTESDFYPNGRIILSDLLPALGRQYKFYFTTDQNGSLNFWPSGVQTAGVELAQIREDNGLIEYPQQISNTQYQFKTLFGMPGMYYPGDTVSVKSASIPNGQASGLIVDAAYSWQDDQAEIQYKYSLTGYPVEIYPAVQI